MGQQPSHARHPTGPCRRIVRRALKYVWTPVGAGVKTQEETDALALYLMGDGSDEGAEAARGIDETIAELPGLEGLTLTQGYLEGAKRRARERPGWAGVAPMPDRGEPSTAGTREHWPSPEDTSRDDDPEPLAAASPTDGHRPEKTPPA